MKDSDNFLRDLAGSQPLEVLGVQIAVLDKSLRICSVAGDQQLAIQLTPEMVGRSIEDVCSRAPVDLVDRIQLCQQLKTPLEEPFQAADGSWFRLRIVPVVKTDEIDGLIVAIADITDQELAQEALQRSEQRYALALQGMCDGIWEWDLIDNFVFYSPMFLRLLDRTGTDPIPNTIEFLDKRIHPDDHQQTWDALQSHFANRTPFENELRLRNDAGSYRWFRLTGQAEWSASGQPSRFASVLQDISDLRDANQTLALAKLSVERLSEAIFWLAEDDRIIYVNRSACELLGYRRDELVGIRFGKLDTASNSSWTELVEQWVAGSDGSWADNVERCIRRKDGSEIAVAVSLSHLRLDGKKFCCATVRDVTVAKQREEQAREELQRHSRFLSVLSHELRNPMSAIVNAARLHSKPNSKPDVLRYASEVIQRQSQQMASLLEDLLDVSRITQGRLELKQEPVDIAKLVDDALEAVEPARQAKAVAIDLVRPSQPVIVRGDAVRLLQIQTNLLANAIKHTSCSDQITLGVEAADGTATIYVKDTGVGIEAELLSQMFDMFVQGSSPQSRSDGMGIGLTLVKALAELHGGTVVAISDGLGKGAEFRVTLPSIPDTRVQGTEVRPVSRSRKRIVIVEDNPDARETLKLLLSDLGEIATANDGEAGADLILKSRPDIAIVDIDLPKLSGIEVARRVRDAGVSDVTLIALTGHGQRFDQIASREAGFDDHLIKPLDPRRLEPYL